MSWFLPWSLLRTASTRAADSICRHSAISLFRSRAVTSLVAIFHSRSSIPIWKILTGAALSRDFFSASIDIRNLFSAPLSLSYFVGKNDTFGSGDGFAQFGAAPIMTSYRGFLYFPNYPVGPLYDGIYQVHGTGAHLQYVPKVETLSMDLYVYEDTHAAFTMLGNYSGDFRFLLNFPSIKLEGFVGSTYLLTTNSFAFRGGLLFYASNRNVEFLSQIGIPVWNPLLDATPNINLFYLLVEPRLHLGLLSIVPTFFWHPGYYEQQAIPTSWVLST